MLVNLRALLVRLIDIILLRGGPEQLPASPVLLVVLVLLNSALSTLIAALIPELPGATIFEFIVGPLVPLLWYFVAFRIVEKPERFVQTMTAFFGVNIIFQPAIAPMLAELKPYLENPDPANPAPAVLSLLFLVIGAWVLTIWVRIVRAAFEWPIFVSIAFVLAQNIVAVIAYGALFQLSPAKV